MTAVVIAVERTAAPIGGYSRFVRVEVPSRSVTADERPQRVGATGAVGGERCRAFVTATGSLSMYTTRASGITVRAVS